MKAITTGFRIVTLMAAAGAFGVGIYYGTFAASDTDPYGYVSAAESIAGGALRIDQRFALSLPFPEAEAAFVPPAYKKATIPGFIVPTYSTGLPLVMAAMLRLTGQREAVFYAVPLLGALLVCMTALLGRRVHSRLAGVSAAVLVATSPSFLYQVMQPVSDIAAAAWWTMSLVLVLQSGRWSAAGAGAAASMAVLTRPNLVPLALVLAGYYAWRTLRRASPDRRADAIRLTLFAAGLLPGCLALAALNQYLYGSPVRSGYPPLSELYAWARVMPNLDRYPRWLMETQTPFIGLAVVAPFLVRRHRARAWVALVFAGVICVSYLPYGVFGRDEWTFVRYLLPAYPALIVLSVTAGLELLRRVVARKAPSRLGLTQAGSGRAVVAISLACVAGLALWQVRESLQRGAFVTWFGEQRYVDVGRFVGGLSRDAVVVAGLHAGSIRYYGGQLTIDYPSLQPRALEQAFATFDRMGRRVYLVLDGGEEALFRRHFAADTELGRLDWPPIAETLRILPVRIYDLSDRAMFFAGHPVFTYDMDDVIKEPILRKR